MDNTELRKLMVEVAKKDLGEDEKSREQLVKQFKDWLEQNPDIRNYKGDDGIPLLYLRKGKFSLQKAEEIFLKAQNFRNLYSHFMGDSDIFDPKVKFFATNGYHYVSPFTDDNGCHVIFVHMSRVDPSKSDYTDYIRAQVATASAMMYKEVPQVLGVIYVVDMADITAAHVTHMPLGDFLAYMKAVQQCIPLRFKGFHFLNMPGPIKWFFDLIVSNATEKMRSRFMAHNSLEDLQKHVSVRVLPKEYGGTMPMQEMIDLWYKDLLAARDITTYWNSLRLVTPENADLKTTLAQLPGSFRKLEVD